MKTAKFVKDIIVTDPDTNAPVDVAIYKDLESGGMFGIDTSFIITLADDDPVNNPFNGKEITLIGE